MRWVAFAVRVANRRPKSRANRRYACPNAGVMNTFQNSLSVLRPRRSRTARRGKFRSLRRSLWTLEDYGECDERVDEPASAFVEATADSGLRSTSPPACIR